MHLIRKGTSLAGVVLLSVLLHPAAASSLSRPGGMNPATCCPMVQPGSGIKVAGIPCSAGFLFRGHHNARLLSTAGHCVMGNGSATTRAGDRTWLAGKGPDVRLASDGALVGHVIYATREENESDFALIELLPIVLARPGTVAGGAVTLSNSGVQVGDRVDLAGQGVGVSAVAPGRTGFVSGTSQPHAFTITLPALPGDSGGPITSSNGAALGLIIRGGGFVVPDPGVAQVIRLNVMLARVKHQAGLAPRLWTTT